MKSKIILISFATIAWREISRMLRISVQVFLPPIITMSLYFLIFGNIIGNRIGDVSGVDYATYIAPGLIMITVITNAYNNTCSSFFSTRFQHNIDELLISPTPYSIIMLGFALGGVIRGIIVAIIVAIVIHFFLPLSVYNFPLTALVVVLTALLFALAGFTNALYAKKFDDVSIIPTFVLTPLTYLGGVFYSVSALPPFWRHLSDFNPIVYIVGCFRYAVLGVNGLNVYASLSIIVLCCFLFAGFNLLLMHRGVGLKQ